MLLRKKVLWYHHVFYHIEQNGSTMILFDVPHSNMVDMVLLNNIDHIFILVILW